MGRTPRTDSMIEKVHEVRPQAPPAGSRPAPAVPQKNPAMTGNQGGFHAALQPLVGKVVTLVNPESLEETPVGRQLTTAFYPGKVLSLGADFVTLALEFKRRTGTQDSEPVRQYIPLHRIKRVSIMKSARLIHL